MRLREIRRAKNITQQQLGEVIGVNNSIISKYEKGIVTPPADKLARIANFLQVTVDDLFKDTVNSQEPIQENTPVFIEFKNTKHSFSQEDYDPIDRDAIGKMYAKALKRSKGHCELCGRDAIFNLPDGSPYLLAHIIPVRSRSGKLKPVKVLAVCQLCNLKQSLH